MIGVAETFNLPKRFKILFEAENSKSKIWWNFLVLVSFWQISSLRLGSYSCLIASYLSFPYIPPSLLPTMLRDIASWFPFITIRYFHSFWYISLPSTSTIAYYCQIQLSGSLSLPYRSSSLLISLPPELLLAPFPILIIHLAPSRVISQNVRPVLPTGDKSSMILERKLNSSLFCFQ